MDVYETPHAQFKQLAGPHDQKRDVDEPDVQNRDLAMPHAHFPHVGDPHVDLPHVGNGHNINKRDLKRREIKKEERQQLIAAAAGAGMAKKESFASRYPLDQIEAFIRATKPHKTEAQIGGLARHLQGSGEEDELIAEWQARQILTQARMDHPEDCDLCQGTRWQVIPGRGARPCPNLLLKELPE
jgi:hypothetical protein